MSSSVRVWLAEKPSFGKDLAKALGNPRRLDRYAWETDRGIVVAAAGHLVELAEPQDYEEKWAQWLPENLPMIPPGWNFLYKRNEKKYDRLKGIGKYLTKATEIVVATDAGREGEYIAWAIFEFYDLHRLPKKRLWTSGANVSAIAKAAKEESLLPYDEKYPLAEAARIRAESDWVEGLNLTRLLTTRYQPADYREPISVGRVQTAALAIIVRRHLEIENHKPEKYFNLAIDVTAANQPVRLMHRPSEEDRIKDASEARRIIDAVRGQTISLKVDSQIKNEAPPKLFESSSLQIRAYNLWGWPADKTEKLSQALYDEHKLISYPRTDGIHLEDEQWYDVRDILRNISALSSAKSVQLKGEQKFADFPLHVPDYDGLQPRDTVFNSKALEKSGADHHGIIPTTEPANLDELTEDERKLYLLIVRQFLAQVLPDCRYAQKSISWTHDSRRFAATGRVIKMQGWRVLFNDADQAAEASENEVEQEEEPQNLPDLNDGERGQIDRAFAEEKFTIAPPQFTEGSIISAMRDLNKVVKDKALREKLKHAKTIGTKSTWGETIKKLKDRMYITSHRGKLSPTILGVDLVALCDKELPTLVDPTATAALEFMLSDVEKRKCEPAQARKILQSRNVDAIRRCLNIESATLRAPPQAARKAKANKKFDGKPKPFKDFDGGSHALVVPFDDREQVKALGGRFNGETKRWHLPKKEHAEADLRGRGWLK
ncbi:DNA topoisomerase [Croceicoccus gelatinilyticus]|uniref:DNA topoisomerase n=1 Tax=Croceicoccus gelatinilyticus TaxID=2835536 RepID=UPI001BCEFA3A|nr:DNA topoisomerase [Croceicoccus gelatinilyticus]MBS7671556.1 hypothetical protein [Croceicoccus gelatinilyticus]